MLGGIILLNLILGLWSVYILFTATVIYDLQPLSLMEKLQITAVGLAFWWIIIPVFALYKIEVFLEK